MKTKNLTLVLALVLSASTTLFSQSLSIRTNPDWSNSLDWIGPAPEYNMAFSAELLHDSDVGLEDITINTGQILTIGLGSAVSTSGNITVKDGGTLIVLGGIVGRDASKSITVEKGIVLVALTGYIIWPGGWYSLEDPAGITVDGNMSIGATFENSVTIAGLGSISASGSVNNSGQVFGCILLANGCCESPGCTLTNAPLPIELTSFSGTPEARNVVLNWTTASEITSDYFTIQRSRDGVQYEDIGSIQAAGNSTWEVDYLFTDTEPLIGVSYYRLKQTDFNGEWALLDAIPIYVENNVEGLFSIYPNPSAQRELKIRLSQKAKNVTVTLRDMMGVTGGTWQFENLDENSQSFIQLNDQIKPGSYIMAITADKIHSQKVLILE